MYRANLIIVISRLIRYAFPTMEPGSVNYIETHDDLLPGPAEWSATIMVDKDKFQFLPLWRSAPLPVRFSNLQKWAIKKILPEGTFIH